MGADDGVYGIKTKKYTQVKGKACSKQPNHLIYSYEVISMPDEKKFLKHKIVIDNRENVILTGITDVISFDDQMIVTDTDLGTLIIKGDNLHISNLNVEKGDVSIFGEIVSINYEAIAYSKQKKAFLGKLFK